MSRSIHETRKDLKGATKVELEEMANDPDSILYKLADKRAVKKEVTSGQRDGPERCDTQRDARWALKGGRSSPARLPLACDDERLWASKRTHFFNYFVSTTE